MDMLRQRAINHLTKNVEQRDRLGQQLNQHQAIGTTNLQHRSRLSQVPFWQNQLRTQRAHLSTNYKPTQLNQHRIQRALLSNQKKSLQHNQLRF